MKFSRKTFLSMKRLTGTFLLLGFVFLSGFSPILHSHEEAAFHSDCAACHWTQQSPDSISGETGERQALSGPACTGVGTFAVLSRPGLIFKSRAPPSFS